MAKKENILKRLFGIDLRSLALFRVLVSLILLGDLSIRLADLVAHYTDWGAIPRLAVIENWWRPGYFSLHMMSGELGFQIAFFALHFIAVFCLLIGFHTRLAGLLSWLLLISLHTRNPIILQGGDILIRCVLFFANFLPMGARYSVDHAMSLKLPLKKEESSETQTVFSPASAGILLQVAFMYVFTAFLKSGKEWYPDGTAIEYALAIEQFTKPMGSWMRSLPQFMHWATLSTWWFELVGPIFLFSPIFFLPLRWLAIGGFVGLHFGLFTSMELGIFPWISVASMAPFIPGESWDWLERCFRKRIKKNASAFYDDDCGFCKRMVLLLREFLLVEDVSFQPAQSVKQIQAAMERERSWVVVGENATKHFGYDGILKVAESSILVRHLVPLFSLKMFRIPGNIGYRFVANRRAFFGRVFSLLKFKSLTLGIPKFFHGVSLFFLLLVFWWNVSTIKKWEVPFPDSLEWVGNVVRLDQLWDMFAPYPLTEDGWYVIPGKLENGSEVDVLHQVEVPPQWEKPRRISATFSNDRWRSYLMMLWNVEFEPFRLYFGKYLCRTWNQDRWEGKRLKSFEMYFMLQKIQSGGKYAPVEKVLLWEHLCLAEEGEPVSNSASGAN